MSQLSFRPEGYEGSVEQYLPKVRNAIVNALAQAQKGLSQATLGLERPFLEALAAILVEFAEEAQTQHSRHQPQSSGLHFADRRNGEMKPPRRTHRRRKRA